VYVSMPIVKRFLSWSS